MAIRLTVEIQYSVRRSDKGMKKITVDLEKTVHMVEQVSRNRLILAIFLVVDGVIFLMNPERPVEDMERAVALCMILTAGAMIIAKITARERFSSFLPALLLLAAGGLMHFFPDALSAYFRLMLALLIVINGSLNLLSILGLNRAKETLAAMESKGKNALSRLKKSKDLENGFQEQTKKYLRPLHQVVSETEGHKVVSFVTNLLSVILGVLLLVQANISITVFGLIFIYVGISDFLLAFGTRKIAQKLRDRKFKEILFEETDEHEKSTIEQDPD